MQLLSKIVESLKKNHMPDTLQMITKLLKKETQILFGFLFLYELFSLYHFIKLK
ncbi:MAG: hypothetical protein QG561_226 [Patescibacteria group bacterium]|nr:hypothetical protein [Patescibacteria group bacterium]